MRRLILSFLRKVAPPIYRTFPVVRRIRYAIPEMDFARWLVRCNPTGFIRRRMARHDLKLYQQLFAAAVGRGPEYVPYSETRAPLTPEIKLIAFYLPQFHPIPENDAWWGKGFTEWTNVSKAVPQFAGHYQPRLPDELGFYDLRIPEIQERQVEIARNYGIYGFCFHYYWFSGGKRLLERPLDQFLSNPNIDFPFCVCWANENWTRRWDGLESDVLIEQKHGPDDDAAFIGDLLPLLRNPRYIRVQGKPLIIVYRVDILPDARRTAETWRKICHTQGVGELMLVAAQTFGTVDPRPYGFDAAVEFPPHLSHRGYLDKSPLFFNPDCRSEVFSYARLVESFSGFEWPEFPVFKTVAPAWDNEARKPGNSAIYHQATPELFRKWLDTACAWTNKRYPIDEDKLVFINAWNEWAEGAYLEPDRRFGYSYLQSVRSALAGENENEDARRRIAIVGHDANPFGAEFIALNLCRMFKEGFGFDLEIILLGGGPMESRFQQYGNLHVVESKNFDSIHDKIVIDRARSCKTVIANTLVSGPICRFLKQDDNLIISLVHEMPNYVKQNKFSKNAKAAAQYADIVVFPSEVVKREFNSIYHVNNDKTRIRPQGIIKCWGVGENVELVRSKLREKFGLSENAKLVLGVGHAGLRKGVDLFVEVGVRLCTSRSDTVCLWVGRFDHDIEASVRDRIVSADLEDRITFVGEVEHEDIEEFYFGSDLYLLTSREDPFPSTVLEALCARLPVLGFDGATGCGPLIEQCGRLVPQFDIEVMAATAEFFLNNAAHSRELGARGREIIEADFSFRSYAFDIAAMGMPSLKRISVIVPTYNHRQFLEKRIHSIREQSYPIYEVIVLDDASSDGTAEWLSDNLEDLLPGARLVRNRSNSGNVWDQWSKGVAATKGDYVWIAEDDDISHPEFLQRMLSVLDTSGAAMAFCDSFQIDEAGRKIGESYAQYCNAATGGPPRFDRDFVLDGRRFVEECLSVKNTILNVSSVLWRRKDLTSALTSAKPELARFGVAGDWRLYCEVGFTGGSIAYLADPLNGHRRHTATITSTLDASRHLQEIATMQDFVSNRIALSELHIAQQRNYRDAVSAHLGLHESRSIEN